MDKSARNLRAAIEASGLKSGMSISFHHHLRNGDKVLNMVLAEAASMGMKDLTLNASSLFDVHLPLIVHIKSGVVSKIRTNYMARGIGEFISKGGMKEPVEFRTHGGRPYDIERGITPIDVAFIAAPTADPMGNATGKVGKSACGSLGYAMPDAVHAGKTVIITDNLVPYPLAAPSITEDMVDIVVSVEEIGDPAGIVSGTTKITRDPIGLIMAETAVQVIRHSGLLKDGFSFQTGAGGASLAAAGILKDVMLKEGIKGSFALGGITGYLVDMLNEGCFESLMDVQCFDLKAVESIRTNPAHREISASLYASPGTKSSAVENLDVVILGATEMDANFNVNVHTDSNGIIMGGSGGHSDTAAGAKMSMIIAPIFRGRLPLVRDRVGCISTPGGTVDVLVTQKGVAVNPKRPELAEALKGGGMRLRSIEELKAEAEKLCGIPKGLPKDGREVAKVIYRDGSLLDTIKAVV